jgi:sugar/nucleoside kinase (ribokinase family)
VKAVDTTGAGAAFAAGLIYAQMSGKKTCECLRFASAAGALKALSRGSYRLFKAEEIEKFARSYE